MIKYLLNLSEIALSKIIIVFQKEYFKQMKGNITGDNNSVAIAKISLHYIKMKPIKLNEVLMVRPYIDAISLVSESNTILIKTIENIKNTF